MPPIRVSCVSYLNSLPFVYGLTHHSVADQIILSLDNPAECALKLREGIVDIGLIPVAAIHCVRNANPITNWCIGADGPVKSVTLLSDVPLTEIENIMLDFQSVTSNLLTRILAENHWKIAPHFIPAYSGFENDICKQTAAVVIGDRSLSIQNRFKYVYDLAGEWKNFTGLPFVFARWVGNKEMQSEFLFQFDAALSYGIKHLDELISELKTNHSYQTGTEFYLKNHLSYNFDNRKKMGMDLFLEYAARISAIGITEPQ